MRNKRIFITGLGSISSLGYGSEQTWNNLISQKPTLKTKKWEDERIKDQFYGEMAQVDFKEEINWTGQFPPNTFSKIGLLACKKAIEDAKIILESNNNEIGLVIETTLGASESVEEYLYDLYLKGNSKVSPIKFTKTVANTVLGDVSRIFKLNGPSSLIYSENSVNYGFDIIQKNYSDIIICGGVDHFSISRILSEQESNNIMFDIKSPINLDKYILGDGGAFVVLETEDSLKKRNVKAYSEIIWQNSNFDSENFESTFKRCDFLLDDLLYNINQLIPSNEKILFVSGYNNEEQVIFNESYLINKLQEKYKIGTFLHKSFTGDMKSGSSVMGINLASQILSKNDILPNLSLNDTYNYAIVNCVHEGGGNSQFILKKA